MIRILTAVLFLSATSSPAQAPNMLAALDQFTAPDVPMLGPAESAPIETIFAHLRNERAGRLAGVRGKAKAG
jgi:hypothetical protein